MARTPLASRQAMTLLDAFLSRPEEWRYGYDLSRETGLKPGTLYPLLMRLEKLGWLEMRWSEPVQNGRPRRHLQRLGAFGQSEAKARLETERSRGNASLLLRPSREAGA